MTRTINSATPAAEVGKEAPASTYFLVRTEHVCGCGHRCVGYAPIGQRITCGHAHEMRRAA